MFQTGRMLVSIALKTLWLYQSGTYISLAGFRSSGNILIMFNPWTLVRNAWSAIFRSRANKPADGGVIMHDPAASLPHDLDDPFFDREVQERIAKVIAKSAASKK